MAGMHMEPYEVEILTKDGRKLPYEINAEAIAYDGKPADMVVFRDISQRKNLEAKLRVVGTLTRHDAQNKLSLVTMNTYLAKKKLAGNHEALQHLNEVELAVGEVERIFDFAKTYEMLGMEKLVSTNVEKTLEETVHLFSDLQNVKVVNDCRGLTVQADSLLRQLFYNLIHNSLKHGQKVSQIRVFYRENGKDQLELVYEDNGVGITKGEKEKIFEERYGNRTGHGLYVIKKICEVYGWSIKETGEHGKNAQFIIAIPKMNTIRK
jgi:signal transduction histidine kinase